MVPGLYSLVLALLVLGPLLGPGCLLLRDAVSTPRSYLTDSALGLGDAAARAVPQDWLLAVLSPVVDGCLVVKLILVGSLCAAGAGAAALARTVLAVSTGPQLVAATVAIWNPYVAERLLQGHWSLLTGYAALPWTVLVAERIRAGGTRRDWAVFGGALAAGGLTPTGALLTAVVAALLIGRRNLLPALALWLAAAAPWLIATALSGAGSGPSDPAGIAAFAARAEPGLATVGSLAGLGGIWNGSAVPGSRTSLFALAGTLILLTVVACGLPTAVRHRTGRILFALAAAAIVLPALGATGWGVSAGEFLVGHVPGTGLLRDTQKFVALAAPAYTLGAAAGCAALAAALRRRTEQFDATLSITTAFVVLILLSLPDIAWGVGGNLRPVQYPAGWAAVATRLDGPGDVAVLPGGMFREFPFSGRVPVLDPAPRLLPRDVLQTGELPVRGRTVAGEGTRARDAEKALQAGAAPNRLAVLGVGWVLVERTSPGPLGASAVTLTQLIPVYTDDDLALYRVPEAVDHTPPHHGRNRILVVAAHILWAAMLLIGLAAVLPRRRLGS
ncbi:hypothetical protein EBN03_05690 [Nocardia stercoris]|uniref:Transmembrane protein n=1 Tax=Nocardia stercoris TaxID=2483361 RepID=A0A3M2LHZ3_9NOCA|nr:hypothetical protein EBN03_05690 [Nocardia stercoris]